MSPTEQRRLERAELINRMQAWRAVFFGDLDAPTPAADLCLAELRGFCFAEASTLPLSEPGPVDPLKLAIREGRRQVFLFVQDRLGSEPQEVVNDDD